MSRSHPVMPGVPAAGHVNRRGHWHPGTEQSCGRCHQPAPDAASWTCWRDPRHTQAGHTQAGHTAGKPGGGVDPHPWFGWPRCAECGASPSYSERAAYVPTHLLLPVYVLAPTARAHAHRAFIAPRSAIVGDPASADDSTGGEGKRVGVHYEGWVHGPAQYGDRDARGLWEAGIEHAAGRKVTGYPTAATASLPRDVIELVAYYSPTSRTLDVFEPQAVTDWLAAPASV